MRSVVPLPRFVAASPFGLPPECTTRTQLDKAPLDRAWVFVMNFRVAKTGCMLVYDKTPENKYLGYLSLTDACTVLGDVRFGFGKAHFRGGYITCYVNVMQRRQRHQQHLAHYRGGPDRRLLFAGARRAFQHCAHPALGSQLDLSLRAYAIPITRTSPCGSASPRPTQRWRR